jgi:hypothetical protein
VRVWELMLACAKRAELIDRLRERPEWGPWLDGLEEAGFATGARARARLEERIPDDLAVELLELHCFPDGFLRGHRLTAHHVPRLRQTRVTALEIHQRYGAESSTAFHERHRLRLPGRKAAVTRRPRAEVVHDVAFYCMVITISVIALPIVYVGGLIYWGLRETVWPNQRVRSHRLVRRMARRMGAKDGHVLTVTTGSGVFGEGPHWRHAETLRHGPVAEALSALLNRAAACGFGPAELPRHSARPLFVGERARPEGRIFPAAGGMPQMWISLVEEGHVFGGWTVVVWSWHLLFWPLKPHKVRVWAPSSSQDGRPSRFGTARRITDGRRVRYFRLVAPEVTPKELVCVDVSLSHSGKVARAEGRSGPAE